MYKSVGATFASLNVITFSVCVLCTVCVYLCVCVLCVCDCTSLSIFKTHQLAYFLSYGRENWGRKKKRG